jgi:penicillin-binding protein 2
MERVFSIKNDLAENRLFLRRIYVALVFIGLMSAGLVVRLMYLQIVGHGHYAMLAKENSVKLTPVPPTRGIIYDRNGKVLAENTPSYSLELIPEQIGDMEDTLKRLQALFGLPDEKIEQFNKQRKR